MASLWRIKESKTNSREKQGQTLRALGAIENSACRGKPVGEEKKIKRKKKWTNQENNDKLWKETDKITNWDEDKQSGGHE